MASRSRIPARARLIDEEWGLDELGGTVRLKVYQHDRWRDPARREWWVQLTRTTAAGKQDACNETRFSGVTGEARKDAQVAEARRLMLQTRQLRGAL